MSRFAANYERVVMSLVNANALAQIVGPNTAVWILQVRRLAIAASVQVHVGRNGDPITLRQGEEIVARESPLDTGFFLTAAAGGAGAEVEFTLIRSDGRDRGPAFDVNTT